MHSMPGKIGTAALGGFAFVFPIVILMQTLAAGGIGGGIAAAVARATGRKLRTDAHDLAVHGLIIATVSGLAFMIGFGRPIFRVLANARGAVDAAAIDVATTYATGCFAGAMVTWILQALALTFRGLGAVADGDRGRGPARRRGPRRQGA
jgi:Na+-driven multidrug efflux pump